MHVLAIELRQKRKKLTVNKRFASELIYGLKQTGCLRTQIGCSRAASTATAGTATGTGKGLEDI
jgi:hypothetical protein